jgi:hypothetical protein
MTSREPGTIGIRWGLGLCAVAAVCLALAVVGWLRFTGAHDAIGDYPAVAAGARDTVTFDAGGQTVFFESTCFGCGTDSTNRAPELTITAPDGTDLPIEGYATDGTASARYSDGFFSYSRGGVDGQPVQTVAIPEPGDYRVQVGESDERDAVLRIGPSVTRAQVTGLVLAAAGLGLGLVALAAGVTVLIVAGGRRRRWRSAPAAGAWP